MIAKYKGSHENAAFPFRYLDGFPYIPRTISANVNLTCTLGNLNSVNVVQGRVTLKCTRGKAKDKMTQAIIKFITSVKDKKGHVMLQFMGHQEVGPRDVFRIFINDGVSYYTAYSRKRYGRGDRIQLRDVVDFQTGTNTVIPLDGIDVKFLRSFTCARILAIHFSSIIQFNTSTIASFVNIAGSDVGLLNNGKGSTKFNEWTMYGHSIVSERKSVKSIRTRYNMLRDSLPGQSIPICTDFENNIRRVYSTMMCHVMGIDRPFRFTIQGESHTVSLTELFNMPHDCFKVTIFCHAMDCNGYRATPEDFVRCQGIFKAVVDYSDKY